MRSVIRGIVYDTKIALVLGRTTRSFNQELMAKYLDEPIEPEDY